MRGPLRHACLVVGGQEVEQPAHLQQALDVVFISAVGDAGLGRVHGGAAEFLGRDHLVGHGLHHVRAGHEHVAGVAHHENEIGHGRRIDVAARARTHDDGNLRDHAGGDHVALEYLAVTAERGDALLDARAAGIEQADDRRARLHRHILDLDDFLRMGLGERAAEHGKILGEGEYGAAVDRAPAGDDAVAGNPALLHAELGRAVLDEHVELLERALVHQQLESFARGELAALVLRVDARLTAAGARASTTFFELVENVLHDRASRLLQYKIHSMYGYLRVSFPSSGSIRGEQSMPKGSRYKALSYCSAALVLAMVAAIAPATAQFPPAPEDQPAAKGKRGGATAASSINGNWSGQLTQVGSQKPYNFELAISGRGAETKYPDLDCTGKLTRVGSSKSYVFYTEAITKGQADKGGRCPDGTITVARQGDDLALGWFGSVQGTTVVAYGTLKKK